MRKNDLWISYQAYVKLNHSRHISSPQKNPQTHRLVTSKSNPKSNVKPTVKTAAGNQQDVNIKMRLEDQPIVAQGHPGQPLKSRETEKEAEVPLQQPIRMQETERAALGQPQVVDGQVRQPIKSRMTEKGPEIPQDQPMGMKHVENEAPKQPQVLEGDPRQTIKSRLLEKEAGHKPAGQNEAENVKVGGRKLLNFQSQNEIEFEMEEEVVMGKIKPDLDIQPENGKLLPWERDGAFDNVQKVRVVVKDKSKCDCCY